MYLGRLLVSILSNFECGHLPAGEFRTPSCAASRYVDIPKPENLFVVVDVVYGGWKRSEIYGGISLGINV